MGHTPLHLAAGYGHADVTKQLIAARCRVDIQDKDGCTSLFITAQQGIHKGLNGHNKDNGSYEIDTRLSSRPESPHVDSLFILLGRRLSSPCISILRMPGSILKTVRVHHAATRFVHPIPTLVSYNREYLQTRNEMRLLSVLNKQNRKDIRTADGLEKPPRS